MTMSSLRISIEPLEMKKSAVRTSPLWTSVSPGGACVVLNFIDKALSEPDSVHISVHKIALTSNIETATEEILTEDILAKRQRKQGNY